MVGGSLGSFPEQRQAGDRVFFLPSDTKKNQQQQQTQSIVPSTNNETFPIWCMMLRFFLKSCQVARNITATITQEL